jgi:hypothetical protein
MFTDEPTTPARLEALIDLVRNMAGRKITSATAKDLLQPEGLPGLSPSSKQAAVTLKAARLMGIIDEKEDGQLVLTKPRDKRPARDIVVEALDKRVLAAKDVEPWFGLFYAYLLGRDGSAAIGKGSDWEVEFNRDVVRGATVSNRFNDSKYIGLRRWMRYAGLGWHDGANTFHPNPYDRLRRKLPEIFGNERRLDIADFMSRLGVICPELDGGALFREANPSFDDRARTCTAGLSHALTDLHLDGVLLLDCPPDSAGWSIAAAEPPNDGASLRTDRVAAIEFLAKAETFR